MKIDLAQGRLTAAEFIASPNHDQRPAGMAMDLLVIHGISLPPGEFGGPYIADLFTNRLNPDIHPYFRDIYQLRVSAHVLIRRDGQVIQFVPFHMRAWHAGKSEFDGRGGCNDFSIGIELEGTDHNAYEPVQYTQLAAVTRAILDAYPAITRERITGHSDIAPGRKTDPGPYFDWPYFRALIA